MRIKLAILAPLALVTAASADNLYSNGSTSPTTPALSPRTSAISGTPAPAGYTFSEAPIQGAYCNTIAGVSSHYVSGIGDFRITDDFTVPAGGWTLQTLTVYAYQPGANGPFSPFNGVNVEIWQGPPGTPGSYPIWGNTTTNRMISSTPTNTYRIYNSVVQPLPPAPDTTRRIWATRVNLGGVFLPQGTYYVNWQYTCVNPDGGAFSPTVTNFGSRGSGNARQLRQAYGTFPGGWVYVRDEGKVPQAPDLMQDFPFLLEGTPGGTATCDPDVNCDGAVNGFDIEAMEQAVNGDMSNFCQADPDYNHDGAVNGFDIEAVEQSVNGAPCP